MFASRVRRLIVCSALLLALPVVASAQQPTVTDKAIDSTGAVQAASNQAPTEDTARPSLSLGPAIAGRSVARGFTPEAESFRVSSNHEMRRSVQTRWALGEADASMLLTQLPAPSPPTPQHTGFKALLFETGADFKAFPRRTSTWVILGVGAGAAALALPIDDETNAHFVGSKTIGRLYAPGKYVGSFPVQVGVATGLYVVGRYIIPHAHGEPKTNKVSHLGFDLTRALIVSQVLTQGVKFAFRKDRPNGDCCGLPSGHAAAAFATAAVLERHLGYRAAWPTLAVAAYVATSRLHDNVHFLSDVLFGSALGMASGWTVVGRHGRSSYAMVPTPTRGGMVLSLVRTVPPAR
jgi:membrane-associated phospholipid phosphatase